VVYIDTQGSARIQGLNGEFGFYINRPFYIVSKMWMNRVIEMKGSEIRISQRVNGRRTQLFMFDEITKTVKTVENGNSIAIAKYGEGWNMITEFTSSRWWQLFRLIGDQIINERGLVISLDGGIDEENRQVVVMENKHLVH